MERLYFIGALIVVIGLGLWRYNYIVADRDAEKLRADNVTATLATRDKEIVAERKNLADANDREKQRSSEKEALQHDYDEKLKCINDGNCVVRMRWGSALCPTTSVHSAEPSTGGSNDLQVQDQRDFARWLAALEHSIELDERAIEGFKKELEVKSAADYCKVK